MSLIFNRNCVFVGCFRVSAASCHYLLLHHNTAHFLEVDPVKMWDEYKNVVTLVIWRDARDFLIFYLHSFLTGLSLPSSLVFSLFEEEVMSYVPPLLHPGYCLSSPQSSPGKSLSVSLSASPRPRPKRPALFQHSDFNIRFSSVYYKNVMKVWNKPFGGNWYET